MIGKKATSLAAEGLRRALRHKDWHQSLQVQKSICKDAQPGLIRRYAVTPASIHDSQILPRFLGT
jgi:hypothetical protein